MLQVLTAVGALGGLTFALTSLLVAAHRRLYVEEDPRIDAVEEMLPHSNCGACGQPGCRPFAEALVRGEVDPAGCTVGTSAEHARIAAFLGVDVGTALRRTARLACAGGANVARDHAVYDGAQSCVAAALAAGGPKACFWGCIGLSDCAAVCDFDAIHMNTHSLPVVDEDACTACGDCVEVCPKDLFTIHDVGHRLWMACRSLEAGDAILDDCEVACTACGRCAMDAPDLVAMEGGLAVVDHSKPPRREAIDRCPTGAIVWIDAERGPVKGPAAKKIVRRGPLPAART